MVNISGENAIGTRYKSQSYFASICFRAPVFVSIHEPLSDQEHVTRSRDRCHHTASNRQAGQGKSMCYRCQEMLYEPDIELKLREVCTEAIKWVEANEPETLQFELYEEHGEDGVKLLMFER